MTALAWPPCAAVGVYLGDAEHLPANDLLRAEALASRESCAALGHPPTTWNPNVGLTFCRCGVAQARGDFAWRNCPHETRTAIGAEGEK